MQPGRGAGAGFESQQKVLSEGSWTLKTTNLSNPIYRKFWKRPSYGDSRSVVAWGWGERDLQGA